MGHSPRQGERIGNYALGEMLWDGSFGTTWTAQDTSGETVVLQLLTYQPFIAELPGLSAHHRIVTNRSISQILAIEKTPPTLVWKFFPGRRLHTFIKELGKIKINIAVYIARKLLELLNFTASRGLVHGGLRSTRILITPDKRVAMTNFGIGHLEQRLLSQLQEDEKVKRFSAIIPYFPQEVLEDQLFDDPKSDIYAVGILLAEMISGEKLHHQQVIERIGEFTSSNKQLVDIISKAVADFSERYHHPNEMYRDLTKLLKSSKQVATIYVPPPNAPVKAISMEAIPADSEEYRVYQAEVFSAKQSIDGQVMLAEPVDNEDENGSIYFERHISPPVAQDTPQLVATFDRKILDTLEKRPLYPHILRSYSYAILTLLAVLCLLSAFTSISSLAILPLYAIVESPGWLASILHFSWLVGVILSFLLPWLPMPEKQTQIPLLVCSSFIAQYFILLLSGCFVKINTTLVFALNFFSLIVVVAIPAVFFIYYRNQQSPSHRNR